MHNICPKRRGKSYPQHELGQAAGRRLGRQAGRQAGGQGAGGRGQENDKIGILSFDIHCSICAAVKRNGFHFILLTQCFSMLDFCC